MKKTLILLLTVLLMLSALPIAAMALEAQDAEEPAMVPVAVYVPEGWDALNLWAWADDGTNAFTAWPGEALEQDGDWYTIQVPGWINSVIINANGGTVQTTDLSVEVGRELWITVKDAETAEVSYEAPQA